MVRQHFDRNLGAVGCRMDDQVSPVLRRFHPRVMHRPDRLVVLLQYVLDFTVPVLRVTAYPSH